MIAVVISYLHAYRGGISRRQEKKRFFNITSGFSTFPNLGPPMLFMKKLLVIP
jgi:hypothetical protein